MTPPFEVILFDIGGVLGSNGWDGEQRRAAVQHFALDPEEFQYRHEEMVGALEAGEVTLDEYLEVTVFAEARSFSRDDFKRFMFSQSVPWPDSIAVAREVASTHDVRMATLNNESAELNCHRIQRFGLHEIFPTFFTSCWLGVRKPTHAIYSRVLGMTQAEPERTLFVDDRIQNLTPARTLGMQTVHFRSADQLRKNLVDMGVLRA